MTYEYRCDRCGESYEVRATVAEKSRGLPVARPACGSTEATQVYTSMSVLTRAGGSGSPPGCCGPGSGAGCC
jgi:putative FmdB family regulatory protein